MIGICDWRRMAATVSKTFGGVAPDSKPRWAASWFTRPSASGSLNGTPSSSTSTPILSNASASRRVASRFGSPAPIYTMKPFLPSRFSRAKHSTMRFIHGIFPLWADCGKRKLSGRAVSFARRDLRFRVGIIFRNPHAVERAIDENKRDEEETYADDHLRHLMLFLHGHRDFRREQAKQSGEFDHRVHGHRAGVLERVAHGIADDGRRVQVGAFLAKLHFHDLLGVVPRAARVRHENRLEQSEERNGHEITDEEIRIEER